MRKWIVIAAACCTLGIAHSQQKPPEPAKPVASEAKASQNASPEASTHQEVSLPLSPGASLVISNTAQVKGGDVQGSAREETSKWGDPITWFTLVIAIANILLWISTRGLAREAKDAGETAKTAAEATRKSVELLEGNATKEIRAYVSVLNAWFEIGKGTQLRAVIGVSNTGQTMAREVRFRATTQVVDPDNAETKFQEMESSGQTVLMPSSKWFVIRTTDYKGLIGDQSAMIAAVNAQAADVLMWGEIEYLDVFGNKRTSTFKFKNGEIRHKATPTGIVFEGWDVLVADDGNDAT